MKYLVIVLIVISSYNLFGQTKDTLNVIDSIQVRNKYLGVYYGSLLSKFNQPMLGISFLSFHNDNLAHLFELWTYKEQEPNTWIVLSASVRYHYLELWNAGLYINAGAGMNMTVLFPVFYTDFGINYQRINISIRMIPPFPSSSIFLTVGINL